MAKISVMPLEPLIIEFNDGSTLKAIFDNEAFMRYTEEFGDLSEALMDEVNNDPYGFYGKILYCALKKAHPDMTLDEAQTILLMSGQDLLFEIARLLIDNFNLKTNPETKKKFKKALREMMTSKEYESLERLGIV